MTAHKVRGAHIYDKIKILKNMARNKREKFKKVMIAVIILFVALMLVLAYMPMIFAPSSPPGEDARTDQQVGNERVPR